MSIITEYLECVFIEVKTRTMTHNKKAIVGVVYRPPTTNIAIIYYHINIIENHKVENKHCYIMGWPSAIGYYLGIPSPCKSLDCPNPQGSGTSRGPRGGEVHLGCLQFTCRLLFSLFTLNRITSTNATGAERVNTFPPGAGVRPQFSALVDQAEVRGSKRRVRTERNSTQSNRNNQYLKRNSR